MSRKDIVDLALKQLGKPYESDINKLSTIKLDDPNPEFFDCSLLVEWCYWNGEKISIPRTAQDQFDFCKSTDNPLPADLGFFIDDKGHIYHVGIVVSDNEIIEARAQQKNTTFKTGLVILRPLIIWNNFNDSKTGHKFAGWRTHPQLI